ncbi:MAG: hypothetical protein B6U87_00605 [Candidatus Aenigmarchaeota archaeon ex4484_52]|nr:MAG: hypothetical protein B6U87_00605 [Candidatus Aenigmarchaeota archaeon ex4484_52]
MVCELGNVNSNTGYALFGKRRIGKTSALKEVQRRVFRNKNIIVIYFSVWDLIEFTLTEFCKKLSAKIIDAYGPTLGLKFKAKELIQTPIAMLKKILDERELKIVYNNLELFILSKKDIDENSLIENTFYLGENLAKKTNTKCVLMLDEFPSVIDLKANNNKIGGSILKKIRSIFENWQRTSLVLAGSTRSTMNLAVLSSASPFYRQLIVKEVNAFEYKYTKQLLLRVLDIPEAGIKEIHKFTAGIPFYINFIGKCLERVSKISLETIKETENKFLQEEGNILFTEEFNSLSSKERLIIISIAKGSHTPKEIADAMENKISNINRFLKYLIDKGHIFKEDSKYFIEDAVFERWLRGKEI